MKSCANTLVVENKPGASGNIGADVVAKADPDGHTFGITPDTVYTVNPLVFGRMTFDPWKDTVPVILLGSFGATMLHVPYKGPAPATADVVGGR